eukprot:TRINITY_DN6001_c0_g1_i1.p1 TRINITY_DN6001_c0_g1~~TRINITY_DN6001_c0_g1_i1.p1  ORF type:complete len:462 (-),score=71.96 TRINITY_DN6001_c0_g1_i1:24-1256(-)
MLGGKKRPHSSGQQQSSLRGTGVSGEEDKPGADVVNGKPSRMCTWRWQVSIRSVADKDANASHFCGGTLISPKWVLTAAHCMEGINDCNLHTLRIVAGDRNQEEDTDPHEVERSVKHVFVHPGYGVQSEMDKDFALVELASPVPLGPCIGVACLPSQEEEGEESSHGQSCNVSGWGAKKSGAWQLPKYMHHAAVSTMSNAKCQKKYKDKGNITDAMLCAQGRSDKGITDTCQGDSGGPLVCKEADRYVLRGVTSWGEGCAEKKHPGVYARVSNQLPWIQDVMAGKVKVPESLTPKPGDFNGSMWLVMEGPCKKDEHDCITSPHYPRKYPNNVGCKIAVNVSAAVPIKVKKFEVEAVYDKLLIGCEEYSGEVTPDGVKPTDDIYWSPDESERARGWKICPSTSETPLEVYP